mgnify:CR=1 FL=1
MKQDHPEIELYFDQKRLIDSQISEQFAAFNESDPRLAGYFDDANDMLRAAEEMRQSLLRKSQKIIEDALHSHGDRVRAR